MLANVLLVLFAFPFIPFIVIWLIARHRKKDKKTALNMAAAGTVPFLIVSVSAMYNETVGTALNGEYIILLFLLLLTGFFGNLQYRKHGSINVPKIIRALWRISFAVLVPSYVLLAVAGLIQSWAA